jgi:hypothetical protein
VKKILSFFGVAILCTSFIFVSNSQAGAPVESCDNLSSLSVEAQSRLLGTLSKTSDSQIYRDQCGNNVAVMHSQLALPQISSEVIASEYQSSNQVSSAVGVPILHSNPSATRKFYLDMDGFTFTTDVRDSIWTIGASWGGMFKDLALPGASIPGLDLDGNPSSFSSAEVAYATEAWQAVAEAFSVLDLDVTTEDPGKSALSRSSLSDVNFGMTAVVSSSAVWSRACNCGGVAYLPSFNQLAQTPNGFNIMSPALTFNKFDPNSNSYISAKDLGGVINHELGHTLGLTHDGTNPGTNPKTSNLEYYPGHGNWAPIMGTSWGKAVRQWSKNEYQDGVPRGSGNGCGEPSGGWYPTPANRDDFSIFTCNDVSLKADDYGNNIANARLLSATDNAITLPGIIGPNNDQDFFKLVLPKKIVISISASPIVKSPMLDILLKIYDSSGATILSINPEMSKGTDGFPLGMDASISKREFVAGTYYISVEGTGSGVPLNTGYSNYGSVGQYSFNIIRYFQSQSPLSISNTTTTAVAGATVTLTSAGGSGDGAVTFATTTDGCSISTAAQTVTKPVSCVVTATKESDGQYLVTVSAPVTFKFSSAAQGALTISNATLSGTAGTDITLTATGGSGAESIDFQTTTAGCSITGTSKNKLTTTKPVTCSVTARNAANGIYAEKISPAVNFLLNPATQTTLEISNPTKTGPAGTAITLTTTGGSGTGAVTYATATAGCSVSGALLNATAIKTCSVTASKAASSIYGAKTSAAASFEFTVASQVALLISNASKSGVAGTAITLTTTDGSGAGAVTYATSSDGCSVRGSALNTTKPTTCVVSATKAANGIYASVTSASAEFTITAKAQAALSVNNATKTAVAGATVTLTSAGGSGAGSVSFATATDGCSISGTALTVTKPATCAVTATKAANGIYASATSVAASFVFSAAPQSTLLVSNSTKTAVAGETITLTSAGGSGAGSVSFATATNGCSISGSALTVTKPATCTVTATKAANGIYASATATATGAKGGFKFTAADQPTLEISNGTKSGPAGTAITLTTSGGSGSGAVTYATTTTGCSVSGALLKATALTICVVTATKAANGIYSAKTSASAEFEFTIANQAALVISNTSKNGIAGTAITLTTTGGSGTGAVTFTTSSDGCSVTGAVLNTTKPTTCVVSATKAANGIYDVVTGSATFTISAAAQSALTISNTTATKTGTAGIAITLTATGGNGAGAIEFQTSTTGCVISGVSLSSSLPRTCSVTVKRLANGIYADSGISNAVIFTFK